MKQLNKYTTFLGLYIAQAIPMSFFTTVVPAIMRQENYSLESIGLLQFVKLPWILKFLWAPLIDKKANTLSQYKKWIIGSEIFYAIIILSIGFFKLETDFNLIITLVILAIFASATQDIATDALAILSLEKHQRSIGNAIQSVGGFLGALIGSGLLLLIYNTFGWQALLIALAAFVLAALLPLKYFNYKIEKKTSTTQISINSITGFFKRKNAWRHTLFLILSYSGMSGLMTMLKPYMIDLEYSLADIGYISGILGTATAAITAFASGFIVKKTSIRKAITVFAILSICVAIYFWQMDQYAFNKTHIIVGVCCLWGVYGMTSVIVYTLAMDWSRAGMEGTDFTIQIVISQLGSLIIAGMSGFIANRIDYQGLFIFEIVLASITFLYIYFIYRHKIRE